MVGSLNKVLVIGNVGRPPEVRYTPNGNPVASFPVATNRRWVTPEGERREETEWFNIVAWNRLAEFCNNYIDKGRKVYVEGRLQTRSWEGQDGQKRYRVEVIARDIQLLDTRPKAAAAAPDEDYAEEDTGQPQPEEEIPF